MKEEIDNILEGFHLNEYDLLEVRKKLLDLFSVRRSYSFEDIKEYKELKDFGIDLMTRDQKIRFDELYLKYQSLIDLFYYS